MLFSFILLATLTPSVVSFGIILVPTALRKTDVPAAPFSPEPHTTGCQRGEEVPFARSHTALREKNDEASSIFKNGDRSLYDFLSSPGDPAQVPTGGSNYFFYNDEIISHLHGYMLLVGLFEARDELFLAAFFGFAGAAAAGTLAGILPANPRVPALVAVLTYILTIVVRYGVGYDPMWFASSIDYAGPADSAILWESGICGLNAIWGLLLWKWFQARNN